MAIKDPLDALEKQFESEDRSTDPVLSRIAQLASELSLPWPADKGIGWITGRLAANRIERIELTLKVIRDELRRHQDQLLALSTGPQGETKHRVGEWLALVEDGLKKAERTRAKERIERIGRILAQSLVRIPAPDPNDVEEMMRIAVELSDLDVESLKELVRLQGERVDRQGRVSRYDGWNSWPQGRWGAKPDGEIDSIFSKLESFGLVTRLAPPNNQNIMADLQNRYSLLKKGADFIQFAQRQ